ncbi:DUF3182 family protein [soil metagenome]
MTSFASAQGLAATSFSSPSPSSLMHPGCVVAWGISKLSYAAAHELATRDGFARRLAAIKHFEYSGEHADGRAYLMPTYFVPSDTLGSADAQAAGIDGVHDLFGGVVPYPFIATKAITHPIFDASAARPTGWNPEFGERVAGAVLTGFSAFSLDDARRAGRSLLGAGVVRVKPVRATGGRGQMVARDPLALDACLDSLDADEVTTHGVVLEENLVLPDTFSIGQIVVDRHVITYHGTQRMTRDSRGDEVYGGSDLTLVRGGFDALLASGLQPEIRLAVDQARLYHDAVVGCYPGFFTSRTNYDIARGRGAMGQWRSGVLEQSWRVGGATGAELAALELFCNEPDRRMVRVSCFERYGDFDLPAGAGIYYSGVDPQVGRLTKYTLVEPHAGNAS